MLGERGWLLMRERVAHCTVNLSLSQQKHSVPKETQVIFSSVSVSVNFCNCEVKKLKSCAAPGWHDAPDEEGNVSGNILEVSECKWWVYPFMLHTKPRSYSSSRYEAKLSTARKTIFFSPCYPVVYVKKGQNIESESLANGLKLQAACRGRAEWLMR